MSLWNELWRRRVPHLLLAYAGGVWALIEVVSFSVARYGLDDAWVDRVLAAGIVLLPAAGWFLWRIGAEGTTRWRLRDTVVFMGSLALAAMAMARIPPHDAMSTQEPVIAAEAPAPKPGRKPTVLLGPIRTADADGMAQEIAFALPVLIETDLMFEEGLVSTSFVSQGARGAVAMLAAAGVKDPRNADAAAWRPTARVQRLDALVLGDLERNANGWQLDLRILRFKPREMTERLQVASTDPTDLVDRATAALRTALRDPGRPANEDPALSLVSSERWPVLHDYARARDLHELQVKPGEAIAVYDRVIEAAPTFALARWHRLSALQAVGSYDIMRPAIVDLVRQIDQLPRLQRFQLQLYEARIRRDSAAEIEILKVWADADPDAAEPRFAIDWARYRKDGDMDVLEQLAATAARATTIDDLLRVAPLFEDRGDPDRARALRTEAMARAPNELQPYLLQAAADVMQGRLDDAERHYRKALALEPSLRQPGLGLARIRFARGEFDAAIADTLAQRDRATHAISRIEATVQAATMLQSLGRNVEAMAALEEVRASTANELNPGDRITQIDAPLAAAIAAAEGYAAAERFIDSVVQLDDAKSQVFHRLQLKFRAAATIPDYARAHALVPALTDAFGAFGNNGVVAMGPYADYVAVAAFPDDAARIDRMLETDARIEATMHTGDIPANRLDSFRGFALKPLIRAGRRDTAKRWLDTWQARSPKAPNMQLMRVEWLLADRQPDAARAILASVAPVVDLADADSDLRREYDSLLAASKD